MLKNDKGIITIPFLLVLIIILFFILSFFGLAMTFSHVSISQYMSYSTARRLALGGKEKERQIAQAIEHYETLRAKFFKPSAYTGAPGDWFEIPPRLEDNNLEFSFERPLNITEENPYRRMFYGAGLGFVSHITKFRIPFLVEEQAFSGIPVAIVSFLGREPSVLECQDEFNKKRGDEIEDKYRGLPDFDKGIINGTGEGDNGC